MFARNYDYNVFIHVVFSLLLTDKDRLRLVFSLIDLLSNSRFGFHQAMMAQNMFYFLIYKGFTTNLHHLFMLKRPLLYKFLERTVNFSDYFCLLTKFVAVKSQQHEV